VLALATLLCGPLQPGSGQATANRAAAGDLKLANRLLGERLYAPAAEEYQRLLETSRPSAPEAIEAHYGLATAKLFLNQLAEARRHFEQFLQIAPDHPNAGTAWFRVGETAYLLGDPEAARRALERFTRSYPGHRHLASAWPYLGDVCLRLGDTVAARAAYEQALATHPDGRLADRARCGLARALAASGQPDQALDLLAPLANATGKEFTDPARFQIGQIHAAAGRFDQALASYEQLERDSPRSPLLGEARLGRAAALIKLDRRGEAETLLQAVIAESPRNLAAQAAYDLGVSQLERGQPAEARSTFEDALRRFAGAPTIPPLMFRAAEAAVRLNQAEDARAGFLKMAALFPRDPWADDALLQAASLALKAGNLDAARETAATLLTQYPQSSLQPNVRLIEARACYEANQAGEAIRLLTDLLNQPDLRPEVAADARYYLGLAYRLDGKEDKASAVLGELARMPASAPAAVSALFLIGQAHIEAGRYAEAVEPLEKFLATQPDAEVAEVALAHLAHARIELDQHEAAWETLGQLETRFPKGKELPRTRLRLGENALQREDYPRACALLRAVAEGDDPTWKARALSGLGWALYRDGKPADAAETLASLLSEAPADPLAPEAAYLRGKALEMAGQTPQALNAYQETTDRYPREKPAANAALARARLLARSGQPADAAEAFAAYLEAYTRPNDEGNDALLAEWGAALIEAGQPAQADTVFTRLLNQFPDSPHAATARLNLAVSAFDTREDKAVEGFLGPLLAPESGVDPELIQKALFLLGRLRVEQAQWSEAAQAFTRLANDFPDGPNRPQALFWRAEVAFREGDPKTAETGFAALVDAQPGGSAVEWVKTARLRRVQCLVLLQRWDDALRQGNALKGELIAGDRLLPELEYQRGRALQSMVPPRFEEARAAYDEVLGADSPDELAARAQFMKGETYFFAEDFLNARREFLKTYTLYAAPRWQAAGLLETGKVYERLDQWAEAVDIYEKLRDRFGESPEAVESVTEAARRLEFARRKAKGPEAARVDPDSDSSATQDRDSTLVPFRPGL
jgi:TolA-binding protein